MAFPPKTILRVQYYRYGFFLYFDAITASGPLKALIFRRKNYSPGVYRKSAIIARAFEYILVSTDLASDGDVR